MRHCFMVFFSLVPATLLGQGAASFNKPLRTIDSIPAPESVALGPEGAWYVSSFGKFDNGADGAIYRVNPERGTREIYARGLEDPCGIVFLGQTLWVADRKGVYRIQGQKPELVFPAASFPRPLHFLNDLAAGPGGTLYVSDTGDSTAAGRGAVFILRPGSRPSILPGSDTVRAQSSANGLLADGGSLYLVGYRTGVLSLRDERGGWHEVARGLGSPDGIASAPGKSGFYVSDNVGGKLYFVPRSPTAGPVQLAWGLQAPADLMVDQKRRLLVIPENDGNRLSVYPPGDSDSH